VRVYSAIDNIMRGYCFSFLFRWLDVAVPSEKDCTSTLSTIIRGRFQVMRFREDHVGNGIGGSLGELYGYGG
jgi:hypothetical protein